MGLEVYNTVNPVFGSADLLEGKPDRYLLTSDMNLRQSSLGREHGLRPSFTRAHEAAHLNHHGECVNAMLTLSAGTGYQKDFVDGLLGQDCS